MLADTLSITYNAVTFNLTKTREQNFSSEYYAENGGRKFTLTVKHTVPATGESGESHLVKLAVEHFDGNNVYLRTVSPWMVIKTFDQAQVSAEASYAAKALKGVLTDAFIDSIVARNS